MSRKKYNNENLRLGILFITAIVFFVCLSFIVKIFFVIQQSKFDAVHSFNVQVTTKSGVDILSFSPNLHTISLLKIDPRIKTNDFSKFLEVPIDASLTISDKNLDINRLPTTFIGSIFSLKNDVKKLTLIDLVRLSIFAKTVGSNSFYERTFSKDASDSQKANLLSLTFLDPTISQDKKSIEVVNATGVFGLGTRLANLISNIGGDVILVSSADFQNKSQIIFYQDKNYTVERLGSYLNFPVVGSKNREVADVIIIIGKDALKNLAF